MMTSLYNRRWANSTTRAGSACPPGVTTGFCDAGMSGMSYSKKFWTEPRDPQRRYGQYFHTQYFGGGPQIAKCTPIETYLKVNIDAMFQRGDTQHMLLAMNELRHQQLEIRGIAEMLWDYPAFEPREYLRATAASSSARPPRRGSPRSTTLLRKVSAPHEERRLQDYPVLLQGHGAAVHRHRQPPQHRDRHRDGFKLNYSYKREIYERASATWARCWSRPGAAARDPEAGAISSTTNSSTPSGSGPRHLQALDRHPGRHRLAQGRPRRRAGALLDAEPLTEELYAAFPNQHGTEKWRYWFRSGTNEDFYLLYNLYQKARLRLEVDSMDFVTEIEPQRHPLSRQRRRRTTRRAGRCGLQLAGRTDQLVGLQRSPYSLTAFPLERMPSRSAASSVYSKWKGIYVADYGLAYRFKLQAPPRSTSPNQRAEARLARRRTDFKPRSQSMTVGHWDWPYRYRNRPPTNVFAFDLFAKDFAAGEVRLGPNLAQGKALPYIVLVEPSLVLYENFRRNEAGSRPDRWRIDDGGGLAEVVALGEYQGELRPTCFELATARRYQPLDLMGLKLQGAKGSKAGPVAEIDFQGEAGGELVLDVRLKAGQADRDGDLAVVDHDGAAVVRVGLSADGKVVAFSEGKAVDVMPYAAGRWLNLKIRLRAERGQYDLTVEDHHLQSKTVKDLALAPSQKPLRGVRLTQAGGEGWIVYAALGAYHHR
jgi:hypothetical protein